MKSMIPSIPCIQNFALQKIITQIHKITFNTLPAFLSLMQDIHYIETLILYCVTFCSMHRSKDLKKILSNTVH